MVLAVGTVRKPKSDDPAVGFILGMNGTRYTEDAVVDALANVGGDSMETRVGRALEWLEGDEAKRETLRVVQSPIAVAVAQTVTTKDLLAAANERKLHLVPRLEEQTAVDDRYQDGGPLEWLIEKLSWAWHCWHDPVIKAHAAERDRLLTGRRKMLTTMERWTRLVKTAEATNNPGKAAELLQEAAGLEAGIVSGLVETNPDAAPAKKRVKRK